ncbi:TIGR02646 family protein [Chimaeribacter arupi]|uniref:retron system putative HNH endonuclease n=1 Tax=Chimaeribacter arupi TaxID=2060066 RepID=UPI002711E404|nr:retron system putative HNH endonuclease [Chimaeribacter arupi]WKZ93894.1 TIGR02646 family protein [Chimaeribacter arupi]
MKKIIKHPGPNPLTTFAQAQPTANWKHFSDHNASQSYQQVKALIFGSQHQLCAYCETHVSLKDHQRIEHFHSKSDLTDPTINWALDWNNVFGVCMGGSKQNSHPLPTNLSCDAFKDRQISLGKLPIACEAEIINPLFLPAFPLLLRFNRGNGHLEPDTEQCAATHIPYPISGTTEEFVARSIAHYNLNCPRLVENRLQVLYAYNRAIEKAKSVNDRQIFGRLCRQRLNAPWQPYFSTWRSLLGRHAERYLRAQGFNG